MNHNFSATRLADSRLTTDLPQIPSPSNQRTRKLTARIKNGLRKSACKFLISCLAASLLTLRPATCHAAVARMPWDPMLLALQDMLVNTVAPAAIGFAFAGSVVLYALGGYDKQAGRLFGSGLGGCIALAVVHLLNYVLP